MHVQQHITRGPGGRLLIAGLAAAAAALSVAPPPADAYYEQTFCNNTYLEPNHYISKCVGDNHTLQKVNANAFAANYVVCAASVNENASRFTSDARCASGFVSKIFNSYVSRGWCGNGQASTVLMDYCVEKF